MRRKRITKKRIEELVRKLAAGEEMEAVLAAWGMTTGEARALLSGGTAQRVIQDMRAMQALQRELAVGRLVPRAAEALERQMGEGAKGELQMRGALTVLGLPVPGAAKGKGETGETRPEMTGALGMTEEEMQAVMKESGEAMEREDAEKYAS